VCRCQKGAAGVVARPKEGRCVVEVITGVVGGRLRNVIPSILRGDVVAVEYLQVGTLPSMTRSLATGVPYESGWR
jgi:hypothetical protein